MDGAVARSASALSAGATGSAAGVAVLAAHAGHFQQKAGESVGSGVGGHVGKGLIAVRVVNMALVR